MSKHLPDHESGPPSESESSDNSMMYILILAAIGFLVFLSKKGGEDEDPENKGAKEAPLSNHGLNETLSPIEKKLTKTDLPFTFKPEVTHVSFLSTPDEFRIGGRLLLEMRLPYDMYPEMVGEVEYTVSPWQTFRNDIFTPDWHISKSVGVVNLRVAGEPKVGEVDLEYTPDIDETQVKMQKVTRKWTVPWGLKKHITNAATGNYTYLFIIEIYLEGEIIARHGWAVGGVVGYSRVTSAAAAYLSGPVDVFHGGCKDSCFGK